jgi:type IV pilus assembly protein PilM
MLFGKRKLTLDFDGHILRMLEVHGKKVLKWDSAAFSPDLMDQGLINDPQSVGDGITRFLSERNVPKRRVVTSISGYRSVSRVLSLPKVKPKNLEETVRRKAKQEMPLPYDETYLSWQQVKSDNEHIVVYALAVPRSIIDRQVETLRIARIKPRVMDYKPLALVRLVNQTNAIIVNLEQHSLVVIVVVNGIPQISRSVPLTSEDADPATKVERLSMELSRTTQFYNDGHRETPLNPELPLFVTGSLFENPDLQDELSEATSFTVERPTLPISLPQDFPMLRYSGNLGLALKKGI